MIFNKLGFSIKARFYLRTSYHPKYRAYSEVFNFLSSSELPTDPVTHPTTPTFVDTDDTCIVIYPAADGPINLNKELAARSRSYFLFIYLFIYLFFFSFSVFPFTLVLPRFLYFFSFPSFLFSSFFLPFSHFCRQTENFPTAKNYWGEGGWTPPHPRSLRPF